MGRYILKSYIEPVGYLGLPYGFFNRKTRQTVFLNEDGYELFLKCTGKKEISTCELSSGQRELLSRFISEGLVYEAQPGEIRDLYREYTFYPTKYRNSAQWSITGNCNYRCKHCYMSAPNGVFGQLSTQECLEICSQLGECGIKNVALTGGEPLIRKDFFQIVDGLLANDVMPGSIMTNGALVTEDLLNELEKRGVYPNFQISYDGTGWHDWLRGVDGAEKQLLKVFKILQEHNLHFSCTMMLHRKNANAIRETVLKVAEYGGSRLKISPVLPEGEWQKHPENALTIEECFQTYLDYIPQFIEDGMPIELNLSGTFAYKNKRAISYLDIGEDDFNPNCTVCRSMYNNIAISPIGVCYPCAGMMTEETEKIFPNLFNTSLKEILSSEWFYKYSGCTVGQVAEHNPTCGNCEYFKRCRGGCRALGYKQGQLDLYHELEEACMFFKNGWNQKFQSFINIVNTIKMN